MSHLQNSTVVILQNYSSIWFLQNFSTSSWYSHLRCLQWALMLKSSFCHGYFGLIKMRMHFYNITTLTFKVTAYKICIIWLTVKYQPLWNSHYIIQHQDNILSVYTCGTIVLLDTSNGFLPSMWYNCRQDQRLTI